MRPIHTFHVLETLKDSPSVPLLRKGSILSDGDSRTVKDVYQQWLLLFIDLGYLTPDCMSRPVHRLWSDLLQMDVLDLNNAFAECLASVRRQDFRGFKGLCSRISSHLYHYVKDDIELVRQGNVYAATRLTQLFSYTSRLSLLDIDLTQQQLEDYREIEDTMLDQFPEALVHTLNLIIRRWIGPFCPVSDLMPKHGPGSVANTTSKSKEQKYKALDSDQLLEYAFGPDNWSQFNPNSERKLDRCSKTIFVAKSYKTFRTISMEPASLQYFQQSVWGAIDRQVTRRPYLRNHIGFHDQTRNNTLARQGSALRNFATLDLSAASDSVSYLLVKKLFRGTWLSRFLVATRSRETLLPDGSRIALKKFAPMGSALCFPIETLIFAAICEHVTRERDASGEYSVFGDDIIVPTQCVDLAMRCLVNLGFRVNREKSFFEDTCWFRESCGGEYFDGYEATPMRISRKYASRDQCVRLQQLISLANTAREKGFKNLRQFFIRRILETPFLSERRETSTIKPLFSPLMLQSDNYSNYHLKKRWSKRYQRIEVLAHVERAYYDPDDLKKQDERIRYHHWLEATAERTSLGDGFQSVICLPIAVIRKAWVEKPYELSDQEFIASHLRLRASRP